MGESVVGLIGILGGAQVILAALVGWIGKLWMERQIQKEIAEQQKGIFVHRIQFEKEFECYTEIWERLVDLKEKTDLLRPVVDPTGLSKEERINPFIDSFKSFEVAVLRNRPFYSEEVFNVAISLLNTSYREHNQYEAGRDGQNFKEYWAGHAKNRDEIQEHIKNACQAIRTRIRTIEVLD